MFSSKQCLKTFITNYSLILGIIIGIFINLSITDFECEQKIEVRSEFNYSSIKTVWKTNATRKITKKPSQLIRPRYYSTELGIREKLFVGILTTEEQIEAKSIHLNKTLEHLVDKVKFFITAQRRSKTKLNYSGLVGFTDTRSRYRPFQVIKYIADNFLEDFDYYFLMNDFDYLNARRLIEIVGKLSVSLNVYMGNVINDGSYCNLDAGILVSNSVLKAMKEHLEWCVMNAVTDDHSENLGRCVYHSTKLECQDVVQGQRIATYKLKNFELAKYLSNLTKRKEFNDAVTVYPILQKDDYYLLHAYYSKLKLLHIKHQMNALAASLSANTSWPAGLHPPTKPATRFDLPMHRYFNLTHVFLPDDFTTIEPHTKSFSDDIGIIISHVRDYIQHGHRFEYRRLVNGYRKFDLGRGLDYELDVEVADTHDNNRLLVKRYQVCKPLGNAEFVQSPYVTENAKLNILLPIEEYQIANAKEFIDEYVKSAMANHEKANLMLIFIYQFNSSSKGTSDPFGDIKDTAVKLSAKYQADDVKVAWVSIRLPSQNDEKPTITLQNYPILNFVVIDLALRKVGVESLVLVLNVYCDVRQDFLNRVRMNTVLNFQIFSPIPFRFYHPSIAGYQNLDISKNSGHFDREEYQIISFYGRDYVEVRKRAKSMVPLTRSDNDIAAILGDYDTQNGNVFEMFVKYTSGNDLHCLRAPDMSLKVRHHDELDLNRTNWFVGTRTQIAKLILAKDEF